MDEKEMMEALRAPFPAKDIQWRAGSTSKDGSRAMALAYLTSRAVMDRLDEVVGPVDWQDTYREWRTKGVMCGIGILDPETGEVIWKYDGADETNFEPTKGGISDAFKRAAVKWGIGRYLYNLETQWVAAEKRGKSTILTATPKLPAWALPGGSPVQKKAQPQPQQTKQKKGLDPGALAESVANDDKKALNAFLERIVEEYDYYESVSDVLAVTKELELSYNAGREGTLAKKLVEYANQQPSEYNDDIPF